MDIIKDVIRNVIVEVAERFYDSPLIILNERELVYQLHSEFSKRFPETIFLKCDTVVEYYKKYKTDFSCNKFSSSRVHQEVTTQGIQDYYRQHKRITKRLDILILKNISEIELVGYSYREGIPSTEFRDSEVAAALEVKFLRGAYSAKNPKIRLRESEFIGLQENIKKLSIIKSKNKNVVTSLVVFSHLPLRFENEQKKKLDQWIRESDVTIPFFTDKNAFNQQSIGTYKSVS